MYTSPHYSTSPSLSSSFLWYCLHYTLPQYLEFSNMEISTGGVPFHPRYLEQGQCYIKDGRMVFPCRSSLNHSNLDVDHKINHCSEQLIGKLVLLNDSAFAIKSGFAVTLWEAAAMKLVSLHTSISAPEVFCTNFVPGNGGINMFLVPGFPLGGKWDRLDQKRPRSPCAVKSRSRSQEYGTSHPHRNSSTDLSNARSMIL